MPVWIDKWSGGRVYVDRNKRRIYVIEKKLDGKRYTVRLAPNVKDPDAELALFLRDPDGYKERNAQTGLASDDEAVVLSKDEVIAFEKYQRSKHLAEAYVRGVSGYLTDWAHALKGKDLRRVTVGELYRLLDATDVWPEARNYRITALRAYCTYLMKRQRLKPAENAAALLEVQKAAPSRILEQQDYSIAEVEQFYRALGLQRVRDYYLIAAKCGMHGTEINRIAKGEVEIIPVGKQGIAAVLRFIHKGKRDHRQSIDAQTLAAVRRLMALKKAPSVRRVHHWTWKAAEELGRKEPVYHGRLRHSFVTWMGDCGSSVKLGRGGLTQAEIASMVGHRSLLMVKDHYDGTKIPAMPVIPLNLYHPEDPITLDASLTRADVAV